MNKRIKAVLFDMDGVLVDSEAYICRAAVEMFREKGYEVAKEDFLQFTGMGENRYLGGVAELHGIPFEVNQDKARTYEIYKEIVRDRLIPLNGVPEFLKKCRSLELLMAVASSADPVKIEVNLREIRIDSSVFKAVVSGLDIENKKPAPDIFILAARLLGLEARDCLVVEDAISGVAAGKAAGAKVLALTTSFSKHELQDADWITSSLATAPDEVLEW